MGRTTRGRRCRLSGRYTNVCYGVDIPVCRHHTSGNIIRSWSWNQGDTHIPKVIKEYLDFYDQCLFVHGIKSIPAVSMTTELFMDTSPDEDTGDVVVKFINRVLSPVSESTSDDGCSICFEKTECSLHCGHSFCNSCIVSWIFKNPSCPLCRKNISRNIKEFQ